MNAILPRIRTWTLLALLFTGRADAQPIGGAGAEVRVVYAAPAGSFGDLFLPAAGPEVAFGLKTESDMRWDGIAEVLRFSRANTNALYYKDLSLSFESYGLGVRGTFYPAGSEGWWGGMMIPSISGSALLQRWSYDRGVYVTDTVNNIRVEALNLRDWSLGIRAAAGIEIPVAPFLDVTAQIGYRITIGEIWPTLALRLEGASGFQMAEVSGGVRWTF